MRKIFAAALVLLAGIAHGQALSGRDLNGDGTADAYYDTAQNITWLADANVYATLGGPLEQDPFRYGIPGDPLPAGNIRLSTAFSWIDTLVVGATDGWRLPQRLIPEDDQAAVCPPRSPCGQRSPWPTELSFLSGLLQAGGLELFSNVQNGLYMTRNSEPGMMFTELRNPLAGPGGGIITDETSFVAGYVWAVHSGDVGVAVAPIPEPSTYALILTGLVGLGAFVRRRIRTQAPL